MIENSCYSMITEKKLKYQIITTLIAVNSIIVQPVWNYSHPQTKQYIARSGNLNLLKSHSWQCASLCAHYGTYSNKLIHIRLLHPTTSDRHNWHRSRTVFNSMYRETHIATRQSHKIMLANHMASDFSYLTRGNISNSMRDRSIAFTSGDQSYIHHSRRLTCSSHHSGQPNSMISIISLKPAHIPLIIIPTRT